MNGFISPYDKMRQYQLRAQIEAEVGNFDEACKMLDKGINITIRNPQAEQFEKFSAFDWYHFSKFAERLLQLQDENEYFKIAKRAIEISRKKFLNYRNKLGDLPKKHPDYITFSKMATCFDILGDKELALQLHDEALRSIDAKIGKDISNNTHSVAFKLVMMANKLVTLEKNNFLNEAEELKKQIKKILDDYFKQVKIPSMKAPFKKWQESFDDVEKMSRAILL